MPELNWLAVVVAAVIIFFVSTAYYVVVAARIVDLTPPDGQEGGLAPWKMGVELIRNLVLATVVAGLAALLDIADIAGALQLGLALWIGFPVILLLGSVIWESVEPMRAASHAGDWLLKLLVASTIVSLWR